MKHETCRTFKAIGRKFLDGKMMIEELHSAADTMAKGMFERGSNITDLFSTGDLNIDPNKLKIADFLRADKKKEDPDFLLGGFSVSQHDQDKRDQQSILSLTSSRELGLLVLPVYVFSLTHQDPDLLFDDYSLVQAFDIHFLSLDLSLSLDPSLLTSLLNS